MADDKKNNDEQAPWDKASVFAKYSLNFVLPLIKLAWRKELVLESLPKLSQGDRSRTLGERLERNYRIECQRVKRLTSHKNGPSGPGNQQEINGITKSFKQQGDDTQEAAGEEVNKPSLVRALFRTFGLELVLANLFNTFVRMFLFPLQTITLGWLLADIRRYSNLRVIADVFVEPTQSGDLILELISEYSTHSDLLDGLFYISGSNHSENYTQPSSASLEEINLQLERDQIKARILAYLCTLVMTTCLASCLLHPFYFKTYHLGMKCRVAACHLIYKKALRLSQQALSTATAGQMINLLSNDVSRFDRVVESIPFLVDGPIQVALITFILSKFYLGLWPTLSGLLIILLFMLLQGVNGRFFGRFRLRAAQRTDERVRLMSELLQAIKVIKMYAWERALWLRIMAARQREMVQVQNTLLVRAINQTLFFMSSKIIVFVMLMVYAWLDSGSLDPELVFVTIGLSNLIRITISMYLANAIAQCAETLISCNRINDFLQLPELRHQSPNELNPMRQHHTLIMPPKVALESSETPPAIKFERAYAWWSSKEHMVLRNLSATIETNQLVLLVGRIGSGKSSLLLSILGELELASGRLELWGQVSYAPQEAWLFAGTVRENILFGAPLELERYQEVVRVCCLERDLKELLKLGDQTQVGERGVALSGGQRARVNLARALYKRADIYLLDDPLAALDVPVAQHIVSACLARPNGFLANKTVLLATHQLQVLRHAERVLLLDQQAPAMFGTPTEILNSNKFQLIDYGRQAFEEASKSLDELDEAPAGEQAMKYDDKTKPVDLQEEEEEASKVIDRKDEELEGQQQQDIASNGQTYLYYLSNLFTPLALIWFVLIIVMAQAIYLWIDFLLARWTDAREQLETLGDQIYKPQNFIDAWSLLEMVQFYGLSIICGLLAVFLLCLTHALASRRASKQLHKNLLERLLSAPMSYFETTPIGRLLNRVSRDLGFVDQTLPLSALDIVLIFSNILAVILLTILINPYNSFVALGLLSLALMLRSLSLCAITRLKQLESISRSPVFSHLSASLNGLATIRAFKLERHFHEQFDSHQDLHSSAWFAFVCTTRWLGQATDWASITFVSLVLIGAIVFQLLLEPNKGQQQSSASLIGLLLSHAVYMPGAFQAAMRQLVEAESQLISVQRLKELCELPAELDDGHTSNLEISCFSPPASKQESFKQLASCPAGCIKFVNVTLRYTNEANAPPVLKELNLLIRPRERIGVVGRTGAGKSSLIGVLFRLYPFEGCVQLDGCDTRSLSLAELRQAMSIIPQEPALFAGSLRYNLDPFGRASDGELWRALEAVQLAGKKSLASGRQTSGSQQQQQQHLFGKPTSEGLSFEISDGGANLSMGQRQLICLARALVRQSKVLVLDEATASVDQETDQLIQATIRRHFAHCTVLTIAHRLATIIDCNRVLVLDAGQVSQFGEPAELLRNESGLFVQMLESNGLQQAAHLRRLIEEAAAAATSERSH